MGSRPLRGALAAGLVCLACAWACSRGKTGGDQVPQGLGRPIATGQAMDLRLSPDGKNALFLTEAKRPRLEGVPPKMLVGVLGAVPVAGGNVRRLGAGVTNAPGGWLFSADSRWALFLTGYNAASQSGELEVADLHSPGAPSVKLGSQVTYMLVSPDSKTLAFVSEGGLRVGPMGIGPYQPVSGEVATVQFSLDSRWIFFKRKLAAAGGLFAVRVGGTEAPRLLGEQVGDYVVSPDSTRVAFARRSEAVRDAYDLYLASLPELRAARVASGSNLFAFSPDGRWLGRTEGQRPGVLGDLVVGPADGLSPQRVAEQVQEFAFAPDSQAIAFLEHYVETARSGTMGVARVPGGKPIKLGERVPNFGWGQDSKYLAFLTRVFKPLYSIDLMLFDTTAEAPAKVHQGVFGYGFSPKNDFLLFRSNCTREGRACDLLRLDLAKPKEPAMKILEGIFSFKPSGNGAKLLISYARTDSDTYDVAVLDFAKNDRRTVDRTIQLPATFTDDEGKAIVYVVTDRDRPGVYVADTLP